MKTDPSLLAPCGLYCGVCAIYIAHRDNNFKLKERLVNLYKGGTPGKGVLPGSEDLTAEDMRCNKCKIPQEPEVPDEEIPSGDEKIMLVDEAGNLERSGPNRSGGPG